MKIRLLAALAVIACASAQSVFAVPIGQKQAGMTWTPGNPTVSQAVTFSIQASDPDGVITAVEVDFGDGSASTIVPSQSLERQIVSCLSGDKFAGTLRHAFSRSGSFLTRLRVTSNPCPDSTANSDYVADYTVTVS
ncbi:MAG: PKD domain-containing protein [Actinomycetota bacterium]